MNWLPILFFVAGNMIADAWIHANVIYGSGMQWSKAAVAILSGGDIRSPIERGESYRNSN